jgi:hypothetical protein
MVPKYAKQKMFICSWISNVPKCFSNQFLYFKSVFFFHLSKGLNPIKRLGIFIPSASALFGPSHSRRSFFCEVEEFSKIVSSKDEIRCYHRKHSSRRATITEAQKNVSIIHCSIFIDARLLLFPANFQPLH